MIQFYSFSFTDSNSTYLTIINSMLTFQDILLVSALLAPFQPILSRLDLVLVTNNSICLFELTIPTNTQQHLLTARAQKEDWYGCLQYNLQLSGLSVNLITIEITGSLGHANTIAQVANACEITKKAVRSLFEQAACIPISCSYRILILELP